jgi:DNA-binding NarL/FixJ family response regulator
MWLANAIVSGSSVAAYEGTLLMVTPIRVLLVDDHTGLRQSLAALLRAEPDIAVVGEAANGQLAIEQALALQPDVVLMDINMPILNGIEATRRIHAQAPSMVILGLSMHQEPALVQRLVEAGAVGFVGKADPVETLLAAIRAVRSADGH